MLMNENPIFILGAHKSGTSLLRSLLDGHPDLFVVPFESHFFENYSYWIDNPIRSNKPKELSADELEQAFSKAISFYNNKSNKYGDVILGRRIDTHRFGKYFQIRSEDNIRKIFEQYYKAIYYSLYHQELSSELRLVEKSVENLEIVPELNALYSQARFVHIIRNPYANLVSLRNFRVKSGGSYPLLSKITRAIYNSLYFAYKNNLAYDNLIVVRYEDLVTDPQAEMKKISKFLGLEYKESLLAPTSLGKPWGGNSVNDSSFRKVSRNRTDSWKKEISRLEIKFVNAYMEEVLEVFGYHLIQPGMGKPIASNRSVSRYLFNYIDLMIQKQIR